MQNSRRDEAKELKSVVDVVAQNVLGWMADSCDCHDVLADPAVWMPSRNWSFVRHPSCVQDAHLCLRFERLDCSLFFFEWQARAEESLSVNAHVLTG